jgi:hypothetical protein
MGEENRQAAPPPPDSCEEGKTGIARGRFDRLFSPRRQHRHIGGTDLAGQFVRLREALDEARICSPGTTTEAVFEMADN